MNVLFCGSREISTSDLKIVARIIKAELFRLNRSSDVVIHGGAVGVDTLVDIFAKERGFPVRVFQPDYNTYGKSACTRRDEEMVRLSDQVIAIWNGHSPGTLYTVNYAISLNKPVRLHRVDRSHQIFLEPRRQLEIT